MEYQLHTAGATRSRHETEVQIQRHGLSGKPIELQPCRYIGQTHRAQLPTQVSAADFDFCQIERALQDVLRALLNRIEARLSPLFKLFAQVVRGGVGPLTLITGAVGGAHRKDS